MNEVALGIAFATELVTEGAKVFSALHQAAQQGRTKMTAQEWASMFASAKAAHASLEAAIAAAPKP